MRTGHRLPYADRREAGRALAHELTAYAGRDDVVVLALPRGGVPVAAEVADALGAPLDVLVVRKLRTPGQPELAMGAVTEVGGVVEVVRNERVLSHLALSQADLDAIIADEVDELHTQEQSYRDGRSSAEVTGKIVIVVDDGLATGSTMRAALAALRRRDPAGLVVAVPVASSHACADLSSVADVVCPWTPEPFSGVGQGYVDFSQTSSDEVRRLLQTHRGRDRETRG